MTLEDLDRLNLFSVTGWKSADGWTVGIQKFAGDPVEYVTRPTLSKALAFFLSASVDMHQLPPPPYQVRA